MQTLPGEKKSFRNFLLWFCSWNFLLDMAGLALLLWLVSFVEDIEQLAQHYLLVMGMCVLAIIRTVYYFVLLIVKIVRKKWKQFFLLLAGFFIELVILACYWALLIYVLAGATLSIGPSH